MKETLDLRGLNFEEGYIAVIDKPLSWTSTDVVRKIKSALRRLGYRKIKVGHAGTLDPLATGVLLVCIGRATKMVDALQAEEKEYVADVMLGATTPSYDLEHPVDATFPTAKPITPSPRDCWTIIAAIVRFLVPISFRTAISRIFPSVSV